MYDEDMYGNLTTHNTMATAALVFGVVSLFTCNNLLLSLPFGALAILFAILSRTEQKMLRKSIIGLICGLFGLAATCSITAISCYRIISDPAALSEYEQTLEEILQYYLDDPSFDLDALMNEL